MQRISITNPQNIIDGTAKKYYFKLRNTGGPKGDKGEKGDTGATGPQGAKGDPCTVVVNSTATLEPGSNAYVTNTGSLSNAVLDFGIPKGDRGPQGAKGDKGDTGAKGDTGPRGPRGERGTNATVYVGTTSTLNPGSQATVYNSGTDSNAVLNFGIPRGAKGDTGSQGPTGPAGQNFAATVVTELPATGDSSKLYLTPKAHTTQTATGNPITATVAEQAGKLESFQLDGDTFQQTYSGSNLLNAVPATSGNLNGLSATIENDGSIHLTGVSTENYSNFLALEAKTLAAGNYVLSVDKNLPFKINLRAVYSDSTSETFYRGSGLDLPISFAKQVASFYVYAGSTISGTTYNETFKAWLSSGSTATAFEPYVGGQPSPNPDYPQPIQTVTGEQTVEIVGKNLFNKDDFVGGNYYVASNGTITEQANYRSVVVPCLPNTTYTVSKKGQSPLRVAYCNTTSVQAGDTAYGYQRDTTANSQALTITTGEQAKTLIVTYKEQGYTVDTDITSLMIELGSTATAYAPYHATSYPIDLGSIELCKLGTYQDYIYKDGEDWKIHKTIGKIELDQNSGWAKLQYGTNAYYSDNSIINSSRDLNSIVGILSPQFTGVSYDNRTAATSNILFLDASGLTHGITVRNTSWATLSDFTTWITNNNGIVCYALLATATDTAITDTDLIAQLEAIRTASLQNGANTITNTATGSNLAGDMEIGYYGYNPTNRYDKWLWLDLNNNYEQIGS